MTSVTSSVDALVERLTKLEDERAILKTVNAYSYGLDYKNVDEVVSYFTPDAVLDVLTGAHARLAKGTRHEKGTIHHGRDQIAAFFQAVNEWGSSPVPGHHCVTNVVIDWDGDTASVVSTLVAIAADPAGRGGTVVGGTTSVVGYGRYVDRMVRSADGTWKFKSRIIDWEAGITAPPDAKE